MLWSGLVEDDDEPETDERFPDDVEADRWREAARKTLRDEEGEPHVLVFEVGDDGAAWWVRATEEEDDACSVVSEILEADEVETGHAPWEGPYASKKDAEHAARELPKLLSGARHP
jgi:hypothetical protein